MTMPPPSDHPKTPSQNLEAISEDDSREIERRRLPRLSLTEEQFRITPLGKVFPVVDLSTGGMALRVLMNEDLVLFSIAARVEGSLNLRREKHLVQAKVKYIAGAVVGCEFEMDTASPSLAALSKFLDPSVLGEELKPIPSSELGPLWYHGPSGTDLLLWRKSDGEYRRMTLFVLGSFIQWDEQSGISTGSSRHSDDANESWGVVRLETMLLRQDPKQDPGKLAIAKALFLGSNLPESLKKWCTRRVEL